MSNVMRLSPFTKPLQLRRPMSFNHSLVMKLDYYSSPNLARFRSEKIHFINGRDNEVVEAKAVAVDDLPVSVQLQPISSETHFHQVVDEAQRLQQSVVIVWVASWCRKCIYLKPKLEKLAADYFPSIRFFLVDVNDVPHKLVARAGVTRMPTVQLWKDGKKQAEVIGGHKAFLVVNEVREIIENEENSSF